MFRERGGRQRRGAVLHDPSDTQGVGGSFRVFFFFKEGSYREEREREDAAEDIIMALETDRNPGQKSVLIYST